LQTHSIFMNLYINFQIFLAGLEDLTQ